MAYRRIALLLALLITSCIVFAQKVVIDDLTARQSITLNGKKVTEISIDSLFGSASHSRIPTQKAVKDYVDAVAGSSIDTFYRSNDTLFIEAGSDTYFAIIPLGASYASELDVSEAAFTIIDAGADTVDLQSVLDEIDFLIANLNTLVGDGTTNLGYTASPTNGVVTNDKGDDATLPLADGTNAGLLAPANFTKLSNYPASPYWTLSGSNIWRNSNVGVGVDPASVARLVIRGTGTTTSTLTGLFEASDGRDILEIRDDGRVLISSPSSAGFLQIGTNINFNIDQYFGGNLGSNGLIRYNTSGFSIGTASSPNLLRYAPSGVYPNFNIGGATATFNGIFRSQGASNFQVTTGNFDYYQTGSNPISFVGNNGSNNITGFRRNSGFTYIGGATTGYYPAFLSDAITVIASLDTANIKIKYGGVLINDSLNFNIPLLDPLFSVKSLWRLGGTGGALQRILDFWTNINDVNGNRAFYSEGTAKSWLRGGLILGETNILNTNNKLEVYGRSSTQQLTGRGSAPGFAVHATNAGTGASGSIVNDESSDLAGRFTITTGTGTLTTGTWITVTFAGSAFAQAPIIDLEADGTKNTQAGLDANILLDNATYIASTTGFILHVDATLLSLLTETRFDISYTIKGGNQ